MNEEHLKSKIKSFICNTFANNDKYHFSFDEVVKIVYNYLKVSKPIEYILCAAIHFRDGKKYDHQPKNIESGYVITGRRHHNCYGSKFVFVKDHMENVQGFITNLDRFVDRKEAYKIAFKANQIIGPNQGYGENDIGLISEDLY